MTPLEALLRFAQSPAAVGDLGPNLTLSPTMRPHAAPPARATWAHEQAWLRQEGFGRLDGLAPPALCTALVAAIEALRARSLPATFIYAFDEVWQIGERVRHALATLLGHDYRLVEDMWAWRVEPGAGRGWPPHRGIAHQRLDRDAPEILNVWIALSDVEADRACMHAIPLDEDPGYPEALHQVDAPLASVRALPVAAGDVLFWNANVLHWGGRCAPRAEGPRISCSFTLCRADATDRFSELPMLAPLETLDLTARMDAIARMLLLYGSADRGDIVGVVREWATLTHRLASRFGQRKSP